MKTILLKSKKIFLALLTLTLVSCTDSGEVNEALNETFETSPTASGQTQEGVCYTDQYGTPEEFISRKLDVLIVIDTSGSIIQERDSIAQGFDFFINQLPTEVDTQFAVLLGHGDTSSWNGTLYQKGSEDRVLSSSALTNAEIIQGLRAKMSNPATNGETDGGEVGLYSLLKLTEGAKLQAAKDAGFFRDDAALAVVFVADEQDICAQFPEGVVPVVDPQGKEDSSFQKYCVDNEGNYLITPQMISERIESISGDQPHVVGGVIYTNNNTMPVGGENEIGYGYKETVEISGGINIDLANGNYNNGLTNLGRMATVSIRPANDFNLSVANVDVDSIQAFVNNSPAAFSYDAEVNQVRLTSERDPFSVAKISYCEKVETPKAVQKLVAGGNHTCALLTSGEVRCFGANSAGQLGIGNTQNIGDDELPSSSPLVDLGGMKAIELSAGFAHTCAILEGGSVKCWGDNMRGQLGLGHTDNIGDDEAVSSAGFVSLPRPARKIYSGTRYNCALLDNANVVCWGENQFGQLGYGHTLNVGDDEAADAYGYVSVGAGVVKMDISTISFHSCAVLNNGNMKCWGFNQFGQLGYGHTMNIGDDELPSSVAAISFSEEILQLSAGFRHTCALVGGQDIRCWGDNSFGQIGSGNAQTIGDDESANSIAVLNMGVNSNMVRSGNFFNCSVSAIGQAHCFGQNNVGQLGHGNTHNLGDDEDILGLTQVNLPESVNAIATGINHACALTSDGGEIICWGQGNLGQLGYGNTNNIGDDESPQGLVSIK
jgi:alpha-tubulin suppressor-like RCC1 family protein